MSLLAGPDADLKHLPVRLDPRAISIGEGVRAGLAVAALVALNEWLQVPALGVAGLGALLTCLCDPGGPVRKRLPALFTFLGVGSLSYLGFSLLREAGVLPASLAASLFIFCAMFARVYGQAAMQVGNLLTVVCILALDHAEEPRDALLLGSVFAAGSLWALLLTMVIWRVHPFRPARAAVADVYRRMGVLAGDISEQMAAASHPDWAAHARAHRRYVRDGIEAARLEVLEVLRARGQGSARGNNLLIQLATADQLFGTVIALSDLLEQGDLSARTALRPALPALRLMLAAIADDIATDQIADERHRGLFLHLLDQIKQGAAASLPDAMVEALLQRLRVAALMTTPEGDTVGGLDRVSPRLTLRRLWETARANLLWRSTGLRHAVRTSTVALPALLLTLPTGAVYAHWLTITLILTLQPFFALTWQRALERGFGTVAGGLIAAAVSLFAHDPVVIAALLFPLAVAAFAVRRVSFGLFMASLTPLVVLLSELGQKGTSEISIALARAGYTVAGGVMAVLGGLLLWPSWEPARVRGDLLAAIRAHAAYADSELAALAGEGTAAAADATRREAGLASNNLETTLTRALHEPSRDSRRDMRGAMVADAALRRVAGRLAALQHAPDLAGAADLAAWRRWLAAGFAALADGRALPHPVPDDEARGALARIARQLALIEGALLPRPAEELSPEAPGAAAAARPATPAHLSPP